MSIRPCPKARFICGKCDQKAAQEDAQAQEAEVAQTRPSQTQALILLPNFKKSL
jgi:hypothetical protein